MNRAITIARRELASYFHSPIAYVAMACFLLAAGVAFMGDFQPGKPAVMRTIFDYMVWFLIVIVPFLSMGLMAQEFATGTIETMMTAPVEESDLVLGKFFGAFGFFLVLLAPTLVYVIMLAIYGPPDFGPIVSGYLGIILVGGFFLAVGLFCSSLTRSQVVAAVLSAAILAPANIVPWAAASQATLSKFWRDVTDQTVLIRYSAFSKGIIDTANIVFFVAVTAVFLFVTVKVVESRRWK